MWIGSETEYAHESRKSSGGVFLTLVAVVVVLAALVFALPEVAGSSLGQFLRI